MSDRRSWRFTDGMLLVVLIGLAIGATRSTWLDIFLMAQRNPEQSHVFLAPFVAGWLFWIRRERLRWIPPRWSLAGTAIVGVGWAMGVFGFSNGLLIVEQFGQLLIVIGAALTILGVNFAWKFLPVFVALLFLLPVPGRIRQEIAIPLQEVTAVITHFGMELFGAPVIRTGNVLIINGYEVAVAEACNGMRMVAALAIVTYAFVFSVPMRQGVRFFLLGISPLVAIACNVIRLTPTVLLYGYADVNIAELFHDISGWLMLFIALGLLWVMLGVLRWLEIPIAPYAVAEE